MQYYAKPKAEDVLCMCMYVCVMWLKATPHHTTLHICYFKKWKDKHRNENRSVKWRSLANKVCMIHVSAQPNQVLEISSLCWHLSNKKYSTIFFGVVKYWSDFYRFFALLHTFVSFCIVLVVEKRFVDRNVSLFSWIVILQTPFKIHCQMAGESFICVA